MIAVIQSDPGCPPGLVGEVLDGAGVEWSLVAVHDREPHPEAPDAAIVLGGRQGAYDGLLHSHLEGTRRWLTDLVAGDVPVLGICLGAQLLAAAVGGDAFLAPRPEAGLLTLDFVADDPLAPLLTGPWIFCHQDTFTLPPWATLVATTGYPAAFRSGSALGLQFHPEAIASMVKLWIDEPGSTAERAGLDPAGFVAEIEAHRDDLADRGRALIAAWLAEALQPASPESAHS